MSAPWTCALLVLTACATGQPASLRSTGSPVSSETPTAAVSPVGEALRSDPFEEQATAELAAPMRHGQGGHGMQMGGAEESADDIAQDARQESHSHGEASP